MVTPRDATVAGIVQRLLGGLRHPVLFLILLTLFVLDLIVPDLLPFVDEIMLGLLTVLAGSWSARRERPTRRPEAPPTSRQEKDVPPPDEKERIRDFEQH